MLLMLLIKLKLHKPIIIYIWWNSGITKLWSGQIEIQFSLCSKNMRWWIILIQKSSFKLLDYSERFDNNNPWQNNRNRVTQRAIIRKHLIRKNLIRKNQSLFFVHHFWKLINWTKLRCWGKFNWKHTIYILQDKLYIYLLQCKNNQSNQHINIQWCVHLHTSSSIHSNAIISIDISHLALLDNVSTSSEKVWYPSLFIIVLVQLGREIT